MEIAYQGIDFNFSYAFVYIKSPDHEQVFENEV